MLSVVKYIRANGLEKTIEDFKLKASYGFKKVHLKYNQLESDYKYEEVRDCRGLILELDTWKVMCMSFYKFFNFQETHAAEIDWETAHILEKLDGSLIALYWDWNQEKWCVATTGTAEATGEVNNKLGTTFADLFWQTAAKLNFNKEALHKQLTFVFELTTPWNIVVKPHSESTITLLAIRHNRSLRETPYSILCKAAKALNVPVVKSFDLNSGNFDALLKTLETMPFSEEGYVVVDGNFNRVKIKNPAYVAAHHLKSKSGEHHILTIIKTNEIEEYVASFIDRKEEIYRLKANYDKLRAKLIMMWMDLQDKRPKNITPAEKKKYAQAVFETTAANELPMFNGLFFGLNDRKISTVNEFLMNYDDKALYKML